MMTTNLPTRQQVDDAAPLDFDQPRAKRQELGFTIKVTMNSYPIEINFSGSIDQLPAVTKRLQALGAMPPPEPSRGGWGGKPKVDRVAPAYNDHGDPCCPVHGARLNWREWEGRKFLSCPAKAKEGEAANKNGYCNIRFQDP